MFLQPIHKCLDLRRKMRSAWIKHGNQARLWTKCLEHFDQFSACEECLNGDSRRLNNAEACNTALNVGIRLIHGDSTPRRMWTIFAVYREVPRQRSVILTGKEADTLVVY